MKNPVCIKLGNGRVLEATKIGRIDALFPVYKNKIEITLTNVFYVKEMEVNLISYSKETDKNKVISLGDTCKIYSIDNELIAIAKKEGRLFKMTSFINKHYVNLTNKEEVSLKEKLHRIHGHVNFKYLKTLYKNELLDGLPKEL